MSKSPEELLNEAMEKTEISEDTMVALAELAKLPPTDYEKVRGEKAKELGWRRSVLDAAVEALRNKYVKDEKPEMPEANFQQSTINLWPAAVDGEALLDELFETIKKYVVCDDNSGHAIALWIVFTWFIDVVDVAPILLIKSPEKRCGKTTLLSLLARLTRLPLSSSNITPAALYYVIEFWNPTLIIDEADSFMKENEQLRGVINSGHTRDTAHVIRMVEGKKGFVPKVFSTWGAKGIAGIKAQAPTIMDRSIVIEMKRKKPDEKVDRLNYAPEELFKNLVAKLKKFSADRAPEVRAARPALPAELNDRAQDNWRPLLAIADACGDRWAKLARAAAKTISGVGEEADGSSSINLLRDIREILQKDIYRNAGEISSEALRVELAIDEEKPWKEYNWKAYKEEDKVISKNQIAKRLKEFKIFPNHLRLDKIIRGYQIRDFDDEFPRYLNPDCGSAEGESSGLGGSEPARPAQGDVNPSEASETNPPDTKEAFRREPDQSGAAALDNVAVKQAIAEGPI